jgi:hypothetical protein
MFNLPTLRPLYGSRCIACGYVWTLHALNHRLPPAVFAGFFVIAASSFLDVFHDA